MWRQLYAPLLVLAIGVLMGGGQKAFAKDDDYIKDIDHAWVKLFDRSDYTGERLSINYPKEVRDMKNMTSDDGHKGVRNIAASAHFQIPKGWALRLYSDPEFRGRHVDLVGTGRPEKKTLNDFKDTAASFKWVRTEDRDRD